MSSDPATEMWNAEAVTFDEAADHGLSEPAVRAAWRDLLLEVLPAAPSRIADLGCGTGTLAVLLADEGYQVDGVDFSPEMVRRARAKAEGRSGTTFVVADASDPPLREARYDAVLCRHVLWAMPDPVAALRNWERLLVPDGSLVLIEGFWSTGAGIRGEDALRLVDSVPRSAHLRHLIDPAYWGRPVTDERYVVVSPPRR